jgi:hypothetical protein
MSALAVKLAELEAEVGNLRKEVHKVDIDTQGRADISESVNALACAIMIENRRRDARGDFWPSPHLARGDPPAAYRRYR